MIFSNLSRVGLNLSSKRFIRKRPALKSWPNDWVPFHWSRPEKVPGYYNSGDLIDLGEPDKRDILPVYRESEELKKLDPDDPLRKIFSPDHGKRSQYNKALVHDHIQDLGLFHHVDHANSLEAKVISLTYSLRQLQEKVKRTGENNRFTGHIRTIANTVKQRRHRWLCTLRDQHKERYERIIKALQIEPLNNPINMPMVMPSREIQMRILAINYAKDLKEKKVEEFMKSIKKEQVEFEKELSLLNLRASRIVDTGDL